MSVTILNCVSKTNKILEENLKELSKKTNTRYIDTKDLNIKYCVGCWGCWVKTPGKCLANDDTNNLLKEVINLDVIIFVTDVSMGFVSSQMKKVNDKMIPLIHPYFDLIDGEIHHMKRYDKYPTVGVLLVTDEELDKKDYENIKSCYSRFTINLRSDLLFCRTDTKELRGLEYELSNI